MKRYLFPLLCTLLLALLLSACGTKADNMSNDFQNDMQNGVQDEVPPVDAVGETGVPLTTGMELDAGEFLDEDVLQIWYGQSKTLLVQKSDGLYWYDVETSDLLAYGAGENCKTFVHPELFELKISGARSVSCSLPLLCIAVNLTPPVLLHPSGIFDFRVPKSNDQAGIVISGDVQHLSRPWCKLIEYLR